MKKNILKLIFILVVLGIGYKVVNYIQDKGNKEVVTKTPVVNENKVEGSYIPGGSNMLSFPKDTGSLITYYSVVRKNSTSGEVSFRWYDIKTQKVIEPDNQYAWFWAMPINVPDDFALTDKWVKFIEGNRDSVFKITGTKGKDDCEYWGLDHCVENINIHTIEVLRRNLSDSETSGWKGKTTDWLGRTYDVNNPGKEYKDDHSKVVSYMGWTVPDYPYFIIDKGELRKVEMNEGISWDSSPIAKKTLDETSLSKIQKQYFYDNNYVPRSVERFDVTGDGIAETIVTSLTLGCGRCVDFYMTIFTNNGKYIAWTNQGTIIKTESGNGFYLTNNDWNNNRSTIDIRKYKWGNSLFTEVARKEVILETK